MAWRNTRTSFGGMKGGWDEDKPSEYKEDKGKREEGVAAATKSAKSFFLAGSGLANSLNSVTVQWYQAL